MTRERANYASLLACLGLCSSACTGYVEAGDPPTPSGTSAGQSQAAAAAANTVTASKGGVRDNLAPLPTWSGAVGSWCGPVDRQTLWLSVTPLARACDAASSSVSTTPAPSGAEALTLELDPQKLTTFPALLDVPARYCAPGAATCTNVQASLQIESYTAGQGLRGSWAFTPAGQGTLRGLLDASWCNWDDFLPAHPEADRLARDIKLKEISVYQGVKVPIVRDLQPIAQRNADLVQQREALVRVFVEPAPGFQARPLDARITLQNPGEAPRRFEQIITVTGASSETDGASSFNIELPKDAFGRGTQLSVELRETSRCSALSGTPSGARFPEQGMAPLGARDTGPIKVMLVPVRYDADGSGRLPDTSPAQLELMRRHMYSMYPTSEVVLSVHAAVATDRTELGDMLDQMRQLRDSDAPPSDLAYYGMVRQTDNFGDYCKGTCTTGIAGFGSQNGTSTAGMGVGFAETAASTFVHELGHIYRRPHAPCGGVASPDESYPYPNGNLGSWGYDFQTHELFEPKTHADFMSYCAPDWISDYNYQQILERIVVVNQHVVVKGLGPPSARRTFRTLRVAKNGQARWGLDLHPQLVPPGDPLSLKALDAKGALLEEVDAFVEEGADGDAAYFIPAGHAEWAAIQVPGGAAVPYADATQNEPFRR